MKIANQPNTIPKSHEIAKKIDDTEDSIKKKNTQSKSKSVDEITSTGDNSNVEIKINQFYGANPLHRRTRPKYYLSYFKAKNI